jgi:hypothetical protein
MDGLNRWTGKRDTFFCPYSLNEWIHCGGHLHISYHLLWGGRHVSGDASIDVVYLFEDRVLRENTLRYRRVLQELAALWLPDVGILLLHRV